MPSRHPTPEALVQALQDRDESARAQLREWLGDPVHRLMQKLQTRHQLPHLLERLTHHALHAAETYLRTRSPADFRSMNVVAFRGAVLIQVARQVVQPFGGGQDGKSAAPEPLPQSDGYHFRTVFLPEEKIGAFSFGGDWFGGRRGEDGTLWLIVADVTGHGYAAYLLANTLPIVWSKCWTDRRLDSAEPGDVLGSMHDLLRDCLPEDIYVECTLLRLARDGQVTVAPAGGSRLLLRRRGQKQLDLLKLRGLWLGFERPMVEDQHTCTLETGDELLLGSDGVFDQMLEYAGRGQDLVPLVAAALQGGSLLDAVEEVLRRALKLETQKDDITVVTIRRL